MEFCIELEISCSNFSIYVWGKGGANQDNLAAVSMKELFNLEWKGGGGHPIKKKLEAIKKIHMLKSFGKTFPHPQKK